MDKLYDIQLENLQQGEKKAATIIYCYPQNLLLLKLLFATLNEVLGRLQQ